MASASISGLVSGLDTATIVSQLMQVEAAPQTLLKNKKSSEESSLSSLQALNTKLRTLVTSAGDLAKTAGWSPYKATSSSEHVTASIVTGSQPSSVSFTVGQTAGKHRLSFTDSAALTDRVTSASSTIVRLDSLDGTVTDIDTGDGTLDGLVKAVNDAKAGVRATTVKLDDGTFRLRVESEATGASSDFTLTNEDGTPLLSGATVTAGRDAAITIGTDTVHSSTNTFAGVVTGLDITIASGTPAGTNVDVTVERDAKAMVDSVKAMVDAANAVLSDISTLTAYNSSTSKAGKLAGDSTLRALRQELLGSISNGLGGQSLADVGVELDRYGKVVFDAAKFESAYVADPTGTSARFAGTGTWTGTGQVTFVSATWRTAPGNHAFQGDASAGTIGGQPTTVSNGLHQGASGTAAEGLAFTVVGTADGTLAYSQGFAARLLAVAERASDATVGTVTSAINGRNNRIDDLEEAIADWDVRLATRRQTLERQYTALEVALGQLQNQSSWLAGQIAGLPSWDSGS